LQQQVILEVEQAKTRSGMPVKTSLKILGVAYRSFYRWRKEEAWNAISTEPIKPVQVYEALSNSFANNAFVLAVCNIQWSATAQFYELISKVAEDSF
jgi:hypothetical protein